MTKTDGSNSARPGLAWGAIFFASGFAGLIYESIWTHYLKLFLGHAAFAQSLVLGIFMGGMALGAGLTGRFAAKARAPLRTYALVEAAIGILALVFHPVFVFLTEGFYDFAASPDLAGGTLSAAKWGLAVLLILPQSILLGATFPLFATGLARINAAAPGRVIATLYFLNSLGGAIGVLWSGFYAIPALGLPGTIAAAGVLNLAIAFTAWRLSGPQLRAQDAEPHPDQHAPLDRLTVLILAVSFATGASSFMYEIGWIRMLSLVQGSATHSFELMLSAFILGLALGGGWVRKRIDGFAEPGRILGVIQVLMGVCALLTLPLYSLSFDVMAEALTRLPKTETGYFWFNLVRYGISAAIMLPAAFFAGMTLPLATRLLYARPERGEKAIGYVYSANTLGAIAGLVLAVHVGLPMLGLKYLVGFGAVLDVLLGAALLEYFGVGGFRRAMGALVSAGALAGIVAYTIAFNPEQMTSGVFRTGKAVAEGRVMAMADGKTASISVVGDTVGQVSIKTNGKADASINMGALPAYTMDEVTMGLIAAMPLMLHPNPRQVANIGMGSGMTSEFLLSDARLEKLDTIEIEPKMVELARHFMPRNRGVYEDPRSAIHIDDAKAFFAAQRKRYDVIVSEPSNPWVSGVSGLFSEEFYRHVRRHLADDGLFAQWLHVYESHPDRVVSVLKALSATYDDYVLVALNYGDLLIVARPKGHIALADIHIDRLGPESRQLLAAFEVAGQADVTYRVLGNKAVFEPYLQRQAVPANSDYRPYLDSHADQDRFMGRGWPEILSLVYSSYPIAQMLAQRPGQPDEMLSTINRHFGNDPPHLAARLTLDELGLSPAPFRAGPWLDEKSVALGRQIAANCRFPPPGDAPFAAAAYAIKVLPFLSPQMAGRVLQRAENDPCFTLLEGGQVEWKHLVEGVAAGDPQAVAQAAEALLASGEGKTETRGRYLLGMALTGYLGMHDTRQAQRIWQTYATPMLGGKPPSLALELLHAHAAKDLEPAQK